MHILFIYTYTYTLIHIYIYIYYRDTRTHFSMYVHIFMICAWVPTCIWSMFMDTCHHILGVNGFRVRTASVIRASSQCYLPPRHLEYSSLAIDPKYVDDVYVIWCNIHSLCLWRGQCAVCQTIWPYVTPFLHLESQPLCYTAWPSLLRACIVQCLNTMAQKMRA